MSFLFGLLYVLGSAAVTYLLALLVILIEQRKIGDHIDEDRNSD